MTAPFNLEQALILSAAAQGPPGVPGSAVVGSVTNLAALGQLSIVSPGAFAFVQSIQRFYTLANPSTLTPDGITVVAGFGGGNWISTLAGNPVAAQKQSTWNVDPVAGSDENTGLTSGAALKTMAEIVRRWGTETPTLFQVTVVYLLNDMATGDVWNASPQLGPGGSFAIQGTLQVALTTTIGTYTPLAHGSAGSGTRGTITAAGVSSWAAYIGDYVLDTSRSPNVRFMIQADMGGGVAAITAPFQVSDGNPQPPVGVPDSGDAITVGRGPNFYAYSLQNIIPGITSAAANATFQRLTLNTPDGFSEVTVNPNVWLIDVSAAANTDINAIQDPIATISFFTNCFFPNSQFTGAGHFVGGAITGNGTYFLDGTIWDGDFIVGATFHVRGSLQVSRAYVLVAGSVTPFQATYLFYPSNYGSPVLYGPGGLTLAFGSRATFSAAVATSYLAASITMGAGLQTNSYYFNYGTLAWAGPVTVSPANVVTFGPLWDPGTGSAFGINY